MAELLQVADRILVMRQGRITGELPRAHNQEEIMRYAAVDRGRRLSAMMQRLLPFLSLIVLFVALAIASPHFLTAHNLSSVVRQTAVINIMSLGMTRDHHRRRHRSVRRRDPRAWAACWARWRWNAASPIPAGMSYRRADRHCFGELATAC